MFIGSCNCGAVEFEVKSQPTDIYFCHCSICRKFSGAGGLPVMIVNKKDFKWKKGKDNIRVWRKPDADWEANFCTTCGSSVPGENDVDHMFIPAGILPDTLDKAEVKHRLFVESKASWDSICDKAKQHKGEFGG